MTRALRFVRLLRLSRRLRIPLTRHNVRAYWIQSDPDWLTKIPDTIQMTDTEWDEYLDLLERL